MTNVLNVGVGNDALAALARDPARQYVLRGVRPAAGHDWSIMVPGHQVWQILAITASLVPTADVGQRIPLLHLSNGNVDIALIVPYGSNTESETGEYTWVSSAYASFNGLAPKQVVTPFPLWTLKPGYAIRTETLSLFLGDRWSTPVVWFYNLGLQR